MDLLWRIPLMFFLFACVIGFVVMLCKWEKHALAAKEREGKAFWTLKNWKSALSYSAFVCVLIVTLYVILMLRADE